MTREALTVYFFTETDGDVKTRLTDVERRRTGKHARRISASAVARILILEQLERLERLQSKNRRQP